MVALNSRGEVADFLDVSQFIPGKSAYECVAYAASLIFYSGAPTHGPTGTVLQASNLAQYWYGKEEGSNLASNTNGMSLQAEYDMLTGMKMHYQERSATVQGVKDALGQENPVLLCGAETGMYDMDLGDIIPYSWTPTGNHCIVACGIASDGNLLVHDCANVGASGVRPGPRTYDASKLQIVSATAVTPPWQGAIMVPQGWQDDGHTLRSPNGVPIVLGFRDFVLAHSWDKDNWALAPEQGMAQLEASNKELGGGSQLLFRWTMLGYTPERGVFVEWVGVELSYLRAQYTSLWTAYQKLAATPAPTQQAPDPRISQYAAKLAAVKMLADQIVAQATT